ncbi:MAG: DUF3105 domain-containing protein [Candidatus Zambryskibacteria bacterium]|nr:DUF3105 domain-containing protein [Candidatus Zambryskibacteria bacterium]
MEENTIKKDEKESRKEKAHFRSKMKKILWSIVIVAILAGVTYISTRPPKPRPGSEFTILGQEHINIDAEHIAYNSNPPTSGPHYVKPAEWGVYQEELPDEQLIHNLEHGGIWISYKPGDEEVKSKLEALGKRFPRSVVVTPRALNDSPITLASWGRLEKLDVYNEDQIKNFIRRNTNKSPEPLAGF